MVLQCQKTINFRDWQGLYELVGFGGELRPHVQQSADQTARILSLWHEKFGERATVQQLLIYLGELDRLDIVDDITNLVG